MANIILPALPECVPTTIMAQVPCLQCVSDSKLQMVELWLWALANNLTLPDDLDEILEASQCWTCLSDTQRYRAWMTTLANQFVSEDNTPEGVIQTLGCLNCMKPGQIKAAIGYLQCKYINGLRVL